MSAITLDNAKETVPQLAKNVLSRDPVLFNSAINTHFAAHSTYKGHGLTLSGASGIKHAAYLLKAIDIGRRAVLDERAVEFDRDTKVAKFEAVRFLKPRFFPVFELAVPVQTTIKFEYPSGFDAQTDDNKSEKDTRLLVSSFEDEWYGERLVKAFPTVGNLLSRFVAPIVSLVILAIANLFFTATRSFHSSARHAFDAVEPRAKSLSERADHMVPSTVKQGLHRGIDDGMNFAEGYGEKVVNAVARVVTGPLRAVEWAAQTGTATINRFLPKTLPLPKPYILSYDDDVYLPSLKKRPATELQGDNGQQRKKHESEADQRELAEPSSPLTSAPEESESVMPPHQDDVADVSPASPAAAVAYIEPKEESDYAAHAVSVPTQVHSEVPNAPAPLAVDPTKESLYDKAVHHEGGSEMHAETSAQGSKSGGSQSKNARKNKKGKKGK